MLFRSGVVRGYRGERRALDGSRFEIVDAVLWTVDGFTAGPGQAAAFDTWIDLGPQTASP